MWKPAGLEMVQRDGATAVRLRAIRHDLDGLLLALAELVPHLTTRSCSLSPETTA